MGTITIKNLTELKDFIVIYRVFLFDIGLKEEACRHNSPGYKMNITKRGNTYTVTDAEEVTRA